MKNGTRILMVVNLVSFVAMVAVDARWQAALNAAAFLYIGFDEICDAIRERK